MSTSTPRLHPVVTRTIRLGAVTAPGLVGRAGQFAMFVALAAVVTPGTYGRLVAVQALVVGLASILGSTTAVAVNAATARVTDAHAIPPRVLWHAMIRGRRRFFCVGAVVSAVVVPAGHRVLTGSTPTSAEIGCLVLLGALGGALPLADAVVAVTAGSGRYLAASTLDAARAVGAGVATLLATLQWGPVIGAFGLVTIDALLVLCLLAAPPGPSSPVVRLADDTRPREGMAAGVLANLLGQVTGWLALLAVQLVGGAVALGVFGVAGRFASLVTLAPVYFGKTVIGQLHDESSAADRWTPRSFLAMLTVLSTVSAGVAFGVLTVGFPGLVDRYEGLSLATAALLAATVVRAVLIGAGYICAARRRWRTWVVADLATLAVTFMGLCIVLLDAGGLGGGGLAGGGLVGAGLAGGNDLIGVICVIGAGNAVGLAVRLVGSRRRATSITEVAR